MNKKLKVVCANKEIDLEDFNGTIYVHSTSTDKDYRGNTVFHPKQLLLELSEKEASLLASSLRKLLGQEEDAKPLSEEKKES